MLYLTFRFRNSKQLAFQRLSHVIVPFKPQQQQLTLFEDPAFGFYEAPTLSEAATSRSQFALREKVGNSSNNVTARKLVVTHVSIALEEPDCH